MKKDIMTILIELLILNAIYYILKPFFTEYNLNLIMSISIFVLIAIATFISQKNKH